MNISEAVTTEYVNVTPDERLSKLRGVFDADPELRAVIVGEGGTLDGVVTRKDLVSSHHSPDEKAKSVMRHPPKVRRAEDVRETARLMVENELQTLPVFEGDRLVGVVTAVDLLRMVQSNLGALDVSDVYTRDVISVAPEATVGEVIHAVRTHKFTRVPVVDDGEVVGMMSVYDLVDFTTRAVDREQGGSHQGFDQHGGSGSRDKERTHTGWGERAGEEARLLNIPVRDLMNDPVETISGDASLDEAFERMLENDQSSLVVTAEGEPLAGIVTTTDFLRALTWTEDDHMDVQVTGVTHMDDLSREDVVERIEKLDGKYQKMDVIEANVRFHRHREKVRGTPLLQATVRLFTDEGRFAGTGEGYGASAAFDDAADKLERNVMDDKTRKMPANQAQHERERTAKLLEWWTEA